MSAKIALPPKIVGIICNWCCYGGADLCGVSRFQYPPHIRLIRVMCSARADIKHIFHAFSNGADGMLVGGCHLDDCHYITHGNYEAMSMVQLAKKLLAHAGVDPRRLRIEWVSAGEGIRFANLMNEFSREIEGLGPLGQAEGEKPDELEAGLAAVTRLIPYIKLVKKEKLSLHLRENPAAYDDLYTMDEIEELLGSVPSFYIDPDRCQACMICSRRCPVNAIDGRKNRIHVIDQKRCIHCGTCLDVCPPKFGAICTIVDEPVPPPPLEEKRMIARKAAS
ncbi:hydrogenase iron-sulfur subunit [uncultured Desulfosarcina sp.]|uniref:hydrogenase iron-sulfur subunit n=1 Tax=uncultured Desulfosarcina sp. TaxID=218289 RepID=UPI0029C6342B|nr:hydrogenase iron-sulfur subunit [uncultured Desulfosarcina sp.]